MEVITCKNEEKLNLKLLIINEPKNLNYHLIII
jgi:hypothetical protein